MASRCVVLDIGGVLEITPSTGWTRRWSERAGLSEAAMDARLGDVWQRGTVGTISEPEVRTAVGTRLSLTLAQVESFMADLWAEYLGTPNQELIDYVKSLRTRCRLGILSNSFVGARELETARYRFDELVEQIVYSHEIGVRKPDPRAFAITCARLDVAAADCLFIDDNEVNVEAAREAGMRAHLFDDNARTIARIEAHLRNHGSPGSPRPTARPVPRSGRGRGRRNRGVRRSR